MAFSRSFLKSTGLTDEQITAVMEEHVSVVDALKQARDEYKAEAEKLPDLQKKLKDIEGGEDYKKKFEDEHKAFENFKKEKANEAKAAQIRAAYRKMLIGEKISENWADKIIKLEDISKMDLDDDGNLKDADTLKAHIQKEYGDYITTTSVKGADVETPPKAGSGKMTREEILKIPDTAARQKAIAENLNLFGKG